MNELDYIIIGAGISGLSLARKLSSKNILILEKSRGVGGRACTRRFDGNRFDHGAQYFSARSSEFKKLTKELLEQNLIKVWFNQLHSIEDNLGNTLEKELKDEYPRYIVPGGMNGLGKYLAFDLKILNQKKVKTLSKDGIFWKVACEDSSEFFAKNLILTSPAEQTLEIIKASNLDSNLKLDNKNLKNISYYKCITILMSFDYDMKLPNPGGFVFKDPEPIAWIADNLAKEVASKTSALTIQCGPKFSEKNFAKTEDEIIKLLNTSRLFSKEPKATQIQKWRYAKLNNYNKEGFTILDNEKTLFCCGEGFLGPRVESAFNSGLALAKHIESKI